jgi:hypothetical protein
VGANCQSDGTRALLKMTLIAPARLPLRLDSEELPPGTWKITISRTLLFLSKVQMTCDCLIVFNCPA